jgi:hypothetical protein
MKKNLVAALIVVGLSACSTSAEDSFIGDRIPDQCGANWPVCDRIAGCRLDAESYVKGLLPGSRQFIVHTQGAAHIDVAMLVTDAQAQGTDTSITFFEPGCGTQYRDDADGRTFFAESQNEAGTAFVRGADVSNEGDHLVVLDSDATASYLLKVTITERNPTSDSSQ